MICSGGTNPGELRSIDTIENRGQIDAINIESSTEVTEVINSINKGQSKYATIVLDHASGLQDLILKEILGLEVIPVQKTWGLARMQDYGQCTVQTKELLRSIISCPLNIAIVAQEREFNNDGDTSIIAPTVGAGLMPQLCGWLNTAVDYIVNTFIRQKIVMKETRTGGKIQKVPMRSKEVEYCLRTAPDPVYTTKFRLPKGALLPTEIVDPDYSKVIETIRGNQQ
jgi:hypothetical protein